MDSVCTAEGRQGEEGGTVLRAGGSTQVSGTSRHQIRILAWEQKQRSRESARSGLESAVSHCGRGADLCASVSSSMKWGWARPALTASGALGELNGGTRGEPSALRVETVVL